MMAGTSIPNFSNDFEITDANEAEVWRANQEMLGVEAKIVDESKRQVPRFLSVVGWKTTIDAVYTWQVFFRQYGGLAPKLRPLARMLQGSKTELPSCPYTEDDRSNW
jgi:hypothetical protein